MSSLRYRANGWDLRFRDRDGRQRTERFAGGTPRRAPTAALERTAEVELQMYRGSYVAREERETRFRLLYQRWWDSRQISETRRYTARLSKRMGPQSVRTCYGLLRGPLRRAVRDRVITDPCIDIALPKLPDITKTFDDVLTAEEVDRLVAAMRDDSSSYAALRTNHRYQALVFMGAWLGPRWNEAIGLRICDVNPLRREVVFGRQVINQNGTQTFAKVGSKTGDWRTVPVPQPVMDALTAHIARYRVEPRARISCSPTPATAISCAATSSGTRSARP